MRNAKTRLDTPESPGDQSDCRLSGGKASTLMKAERSEMQDYTRRIP